MAEAQKPAAEDQGEQELEEQDGEVLPPRELMSIVDIGEGGPIYSLPVEPRDQI